MAYPAYSSADINGDGVINQFSNNDRPAVQIGGGNPYLLPRYPARQPNFFTWDMRLTKDFKFGERYQVRLAADIFNVTNRGNLYSNPDNSGFVPVGPLYADCEQRLFHMRTPYRHPHSREHTGVSPPGPDFARKLSLCRAVGGAV